MHPSVYTAIPVIGVMLILHFVNAGDVSVRFLQTRPLVYLGQISYGLYLWHFPIFVLMFHAGLFSGVVEKAGAICLLVLIASLTYFLIERPFRNASLIPSRLFAVITVISTGLLASFSYGASEDGLAFRVSELVTTPSKPEKIKKHVWFSSQGEASGRIILVGDSHMAAIAPTIRRWSLANGYDVAGSIFEGCPLIAGMQRVAKADLSVRNSCSLKTQNRRLKFINSQKPSIVIMGARLPIFAEETRFDNEEGGFEGEMLDILQNCKKTLTTKAERQRAIKRQLAVTINQIIRAGHQVILIYPIPEVGWHVPQTLHQRIGANQLNAKTIVTRNPVTTSHQRFKSRTASSYAILDSLNADNLYRIYPEQMFCSSAIKGRCITHDSRKSFYRDDDHLSDAGAALLIKQIVPILSTLT